MSKDECCLAILMLMGMDGVHRKHHGGGAGMPIFHAYELDFNAVVRFRQARWQVGMNAGIKHPFLRPEGEFIGELVDIEPLPSVRDYEIWLFVNSTVKEIEHETKSA